MDRYVIKERRLGSEYPQGNQMITFPTSNATGNNITMPEVYYGGRDLQSMQCTGTGFPSMNMNTTHFVPNNTLHNSGPIVSGIDARYLAAYSGNNVSYIAGQQVQEQTMLPENIAFGSNYQNRSLVPVEKVLAKPFLQQRFSNGVPVTEIQRFDTTRSESNENNRNMKILENPQQIIPINSATTRKQSEVNLLKNEVQSQVRSRSEKLKALHKGGPRAFSGPVEKVLKWHKSLQDIGLLVFYEIVAKCVSVRAGERCAKNIVVRDDNGPAMQVVYYEVDFLLPELTLPCTVRVIGRMMPGTCRLQAFHVRLATGDDVATLPRRAAVAAHHVAKLSKEYGRDNEKIIMRIS